MNIVLLLLCTFLSATGTSTWDYAKATKAAQAGDWHNAQTILSSLLVEEPDNSSLLYDVGVAAYRLEQPEKAVAYFSSAHETAQDVQLKEQSLFNRANAYVSLKEFEKALEDYGSVLSLNPANESAKHNRDKVKEMLEQQKQQQKNQEQKQDQKQKQQENKDQQSQNDEGQTDQNQQKSESHEKQEQSKESQSKSDQDNSADSKQEQQQSSNDQKDGKQEQHSNEKSNDQDTDNQQDQLGRDHASSSKESTPKPQEKSEPQDTQRQEKEQAMQAGQEAGDYRKEEMAALEKQLPEYEKWMARAMQQLEKAEEKEQKKMIKAHVAKQAVGRDGQNCW